MSSMTPLGPKAGESIQNPSGANPPGSPDPARWQGAVADAGAEVGQPPRLESNAAELSPDASSYADAIMEGVNARQAAGPAPGGMQLAQVMLPGAPLPLPVPPATMPGSPPVVGRGFGDALDRAGRRLGHIGGEFARGNVSGALGHALLNRPYPPEVDNRYHVPSPRLGKQDAPGVPPGSVTTSIPDPRPPSSTGSPSPAVPDTQERLVPPVLPPRAQLGEGGFTQAPPVPRVLPGTPVDGPRGPEVVVMAAPTPRDGVVGGVPTGTPEAARPGDERGKQEGIRIQVASGNAMAAGGYQVQWHPEIRPEDGIAEGKDPDLRLGGVNGNIADVVAPQSPNPSQVRRAISEKVGEQQAYHIILNLERTNVTREQMEALLQRRPIEGLRELFIIEKNGAISRLLPSPEQITSPSQGGPPRVQ